MPEYSHTLIPDRVDYEPAPKQVADFVTALVELGAAPLDPILTINTLSGETRSGVNPFTGKTETFPIRKSKTLESIATIRSAVEGMDDYNVVMIGKGPPEVPALEFEYDGPYDLLLNCCLREAPVSTSDYHDEVQADLEQKPPFFGRPCDTTMQTGIYHNPSTLEVIEVPNAGCARFWIEFEYGNLFPNISNGLDVLEPSIVAAASETFDVSFVQGCHWCA